MDPTSFCGKGAPAQTGLDINSLLTTPKGFGGDGAPAPVAPNPYGSHAILRTPRMVDAGAAATAFSHPATPTDPGVPSSFMDYLQNRPTSTAAAPAAPAGSANAENAQAAQAAGQGIAKFIGHF